MTKKYKIIRDQPMMTEGVLPYINKNRKVEYKLKKWDNIKKFAGTEAPITVGHPKTKSKKVEENTKVYGHVRYHLGMNGEHVIYGDLYLNPDAPERTGFSQGYECSIIKETGDFKGIKYDSFQDIREIDHCALTNFARNPDTNMIAGDSFETELQNENNDNAIYLKNVIYEYTKELNFDETEMANSNDELVSRVEQLGAKVNKLETKEKEHIVEIDELKKQISTLKADKMAFETKYNAAKEKVDKFEADEQDKRLKEIHAEIKDLENKGFKIEIDETDFKDPEFCERFIKTMKKNLGEIKVVETDEKKDKPEKNKWMAQYDRPKGE